MLGWRTPTIGVTASAFARSRLTPWDLQGRAGWTPVGPISFEVEAGYQKHDLERLSQWVGGPRFTQAAVGVRGAGDDPARFIRGDAGDPR